MKNQDVVKSLILEHKLPEDFISTVDAFYRPLAEAIAAAKNQAGSTLLVGINGSQGSGKTTLDAFLKVLLQEYGCYAVGVSIDDFYLTKAAREDRAQELHPLFATRGVPGTHDLPLALATIDALRCASEDHPVKVPRFNKALDDREPEGNWTLVSQTVDVIILEGWCVASPTCDEHELQSPINELEANEDKDGLWRRSVNEFLLHYHRELFSQIDYLVFLQVPGFEQVYEWRALQEKKLAESWHRSTQDSEGCAIMNESQLKRFIQHYERISRKTFASLAPKADAVLEIDKNHLITHLYFKN